MFALAVPFVLLCMHLSSWLDVFVCVIGVPLVFSVPVFVCRLEGEFVLRLALTFDCRLLFVFVVFASL